MTFACAALVAGANAIALGVFYKMYPERFQFNSPTVWMTSLVTLLSVAVLLSITDLATGQKRIRIRQTKISAQAGAASRSRYRHGLDVKLPV